MNSIKTVKTSQKIDAANKAVDTATHVFKRFLKCCFHAHTNEEPHEWIFHDGKTLIDEAKKRQYDVLAFTCHDHLFCDAKIQEYAEQLGILLIPGIEKTISKKHVLILNATKEAETINSFAALGRYGKNHPRCLIMAPHPFFPGPECLRQDLTENPKLFDAIEFSHFYHKHLNFNKKAESWAKTHNLAFIATGDVHMTEQLDSSYCLVKCDEKNVNSVIEALKNKEFINHSQPLKLGRMLKIFVKLLLVALFSLVKIRYNKSKSKTNGSISEKYQN